jgi:hypothetical protein
LLELSGSIGENLTLYSVIRIFVYFFEARGHKLKTVKRSLSKHIPAERHSHRFDDVHTISALRPIAVEKTFQIGNFVPILDLHKRKNPATTASRKVH